MFFISGFASVSYQIVWQKVLTQTIGVDALSAALIVAIFMLGLGIGGLDGAIVIPSRFDLLRVYMRN
jgi:hypothetical protein